MEVSWFGETDTEIWVCQGRESLENTQDFQLVLEWLYFRSYSKLKIEQPSKRLKPSFRFLSAQLNSGDLPPLDPKQNRSFLEEETIHQSLKLFSDFFKNTT